MDSINKEMASEKLLGETQSGGQMEGVENYGVCAGDTLDHVAG